MTTLSPRSLVLACVFCISTNAFAQEPLDRPDNNSSSARKVMDLIQQRSTNIDAQPADESNQISQGNPPTELRRSPLTEQSSRLLSSPRQQSSPADSASSTEVQSSEVPSGWFRKTTYAWSIGDYNMLSFQLRIAFAKLWPWGLILFAILFSAYFERKRRIGKTTRR